MNELIYAEIKPAFLHLKNFSMNEKNIMSRRKALGSLGAALAAVAVSRGFAAPGETTPTNDNIETLMENPVPT